MMTDYKIITSEVQNKNQKKMDSESNYYAKILVDSATSVYNFYYAKMLYPQISGIQVVPDLNLSNTT